jgi:hypothetical protein
MSDFVSKKLKEIDLGNGKFVKIPEEVSYGEIIDYTKMNEKGGDASINGLIMFLKEWNLKDDSGNVVEISEENIRRLNVDFVNKISKSLTDVFSSFSKKKQDQE